MEIKCSCFILCGIPASGKSFLVKEIKEELLIQFLVTNSCVAFISNDEIENSLKLEHSISFFFN